MSRSPRLAIALVLAACAHGRSPGAPAPSARGVDVVAMDRSVPPGDDFYAYANGAWLRAAEIPPDRATEGSSDRVRRLVEARNRAIVEDAARAGAADPDLRRVGDLYASFMDEAAIEAKGLEPIRKELERIRAIVDAQGLAAELGGLVRADVDALNCSILATTRPLGLWVEQDLNYPSRNAAYLLQGGLGLPDRSYYLDEAPRFSELRAAYRAHLAKLLGLAGFPDAAAVAERVVAFETRLARTHATREETDEVKKGDNPWSRADLERRAPGLDWGAFLAAAELDRQPAFIVWQPAAVAGLARLVRGEPISTWREYLAVRALERAAPLLPRAFADEAFAFHGTALAGTPQQLERWKRGLALVDAHLGEAVGRVYVQRHFPPAAKADVERIVEDVRAALGRRIDSLAWMTPATKARAKEKLAALEVGVGHPARWRDFSGLRIVRGDLVGNVERAERFEYRRNVAKLAEPPDRGEWCMLPQTVNAVNLPIRNALHFPAGIMEPPFYDPGATAAVNYAAIGGIVGHEVSHALDDQGALFDAQGRLRNWWSASDLQSFEAAGDRLAAQFSAYRPFPDVAVNGKLTLGENIADLAGLAAAYDAWRASLGGRPAPPVDGLTGDQQFFVAYAQTWQSKVREATARKRLLTDGHAPGRYRTFTVRNLDPWYAAFDVRPGRALYLEPEARVRIW